MILEVDNKETKDLTNNWSARGQTRHIDTRNYFLREHKKSKESSRQSGDLATRTAVIYLQRILQVLHLSGILSLL